MSKIIWLASYPKSGNTWFRVFLTNLLGNRDEPADINRLGGGPIASAREMFEEATGIESSCLTMDEIERLRPAVYEYLVEKAEDTIYMKVHDAYTFTNHSTPLIPTKATKGVLYIVRNPLDVAVSLAHHEATDIDSAIKEMCDDKYAFCIGPNMLFDQLRQWLLTWSGHVISWVDQGNIPVHVIRYEDMKLNSLDTFTGAVKFAGIERSEEEIAKAIELSSFETLRGQEREKGFRERSQKSESFFRKGETGSWREVLSDQQVEMIVSHHREVMRRFGYLDENNEIVF